jgi:hypothetical protein
MLHNKCGQALQMESRWKAPNPPKAQRSGNRGMPAMARSGDSSDQPEGSDLYGSDCRSIDLSPRAAYFKKSRSLDVLTLCPKTLVTVHPSSLLRTPDPAQRDKGYEEFVADLARAAEYLDGRFPRDL